MYKAAASDVSTDSHLPISAVRFPASCSALIACALFLIVGITVVDDYGVALDESSQRRLAAVTADYIVGNNDNLLRDWDRFYGVAFEMPLLWVERILGLEDSRSIYLSRHLLTHLLFIASGFFCFLLAYRLYGNRLPALFALLLFFLHPRMYAHSFLNSKDLPFLSMFMIALFLIHRAFRKDTFSAFLLCGAGVGILTNIRIMGVMLYAAPLAMRALDLIQAPERAERKHILLTGGLFAMAGALTLYATWPYLWNDPIGHFIESFTRMSHYPNTSYSLFQGKFFLGIDLPAHYITTWFAITTPPFTILLGIVGMIFIFRQAAAHPRDMLRNTTLRFGFLFIGCCILPVLTVVLLRSNLYDGWRQMYFIYTPFCLLSLTGLHGLVSLFNHNTLRKGIYVLTGISVAATIFSMIRIHPYQQVYFNFLTDRATPEYLRTQYDMEYWGMAYREGLEYLAKQHPSAQVHVDSDFDHALKNLSILPKETRQRIATPAVNEADFLITNHRRHVFSGSIAAELPCHLQSQPVFTRKLYGNTILSVISPDKRKCREIYRRTVSGELAARSAFDLYYHTDENTLIYIKESCSKIDTESRFFYTFSLPTRTIFQTAASNMGLTTTTSISTSSAHASTGSV